MILELEEEKAGVEYVSSWCRLLALSGSCNTGINLAEAWWTKRNSKVDSLITGKRCLPISGKPRQRFQII